MKYFIVLVFLISTLSVSAKELIATKDLFSSPSYRSFKINPKGDLIASKVFLDGSYKVIAFKTKTNNALEVFDLPLNRGRNSIESYDWIDENTLYIQFEINNYTNPPHLIDFERNENDFEIKTRELKVSGYIEDSIPKTEGVVVFSAKNDDADGYDLFKVNVNEMTKLDYQGQKEYLEDKPNLSKEFDYAFDFWLDKNNELEMVREITSDKFIYSVLNKADSTWQVFKEISRDNEDRNDRTENKLKIFQPIAKLDDKHIVVLSNEGRDKSAVLLYDYKAGKYGEIIYQSSYYDISAARWDKKQNILHSVYYVERGVRKIKYLNKGDSEIASHLSRKLKRDAIYITDRSLDSSGYIVYSTDSSSSGEFHYYNSENNTLRFLQMAYPSLYEYDFVKGKYIKSKNSNGHLLEGFLYVPEKKNQLKAPMIVMPHGGPIGVQDLNEFDPETQFLINRGYAVLKVNFRGSSGYGHEFMESGRAEFGKGIEQDIDTIVQLALKNKNIDASRLCIYGQSYGGYSALISTVLSKGKYKCAISAFGVTDLPLTFISSNLHQLEEFQKAIKNTVGDIDTDYEKLVDSSPVYRADEIDVPVLLFAGKLDMVAAYEHSSRLNYMLNFFNSDVDFVSYDTEHGHKNWLGDRHQYLTIVEFLDRVLGVSRTYSDKDKDVLAEEFYILGELHRLGKYVNEDKKKAEKYLRLSQKYGHDSAATKLRVMGIYDF